MPQHKLLVCDIKLKSCKPHKQKFTQKRCVWKLKDAKVKEDFRSKVDGHLADTGTGTNVVEIWDNLKCALLKSMDEACGWSKKGNWRKQTWWWNDGVNDAVKRKRKLWKEWKKGGSKEEYLQAKRAAKHAVYTAKKEAEMRKFADTK